MRRCAALVGVLSVWMAFAGPASAQDGAGLYEPFPEPAGPEVSRDYVGDLPAPGPDLAAELTSDQLERGARVPGADLPAGFALPAAAADGAAERAAPGDAIGSPAGWIGAAALVALAGVATVRLARR
jgi:hypothetical protein